MGKTTFDKKIAERSRQHMVKVVVADDEEKVCQLILDLIDWEEKGMEVVGVAHNGIEALEYVKKWHPDLLITDIRMPGYDGLELIQQAKEEKKDLQFIIISGYRHFEYAQSAMQYGVKHYLLKPINQQELSDTLDGICHQYKVKMAQLSEEETLKLRQEHDIANLRTNLFINVLQEETLVPKIEQINEQYHYKFQEGDFLIFIVKFDYAYQQIKLINQSVMKDKIIQITEYLLQPCCYDMECYCEESAIICVANYQPEVKKDVRKHLKTILDELLVQKTIFGNVEFTIGSGLTVTDISQIRESYQCAKISVDERIVKGTGKFLEQVEIVDTRKQVDLLLANFNRIIDVALEVLDKESIIAGIKDLRVGIKREEKINGTEILRLVTEAIHIYIIVLRKHQLMLNQEERTIQQFQEYIQICGTVDKLFECLTESVESTLNQIIEEKKQESIRPIRIAKQYIQQHYMNPISLEEVSNIVGFNATYFSSLFKKESGSNFLEYLSEVRMNKAKELLKETNESVANICEKVGYSDVKHFTKSFKKNAGINPNEYRKLYS